MKPNTGWGYRPYTELFDNRRAVLPYICRLAPHSGGFTVDFIDDTQPDSEHIGYWRPRGNGEFTPVRPDMSGGFYTVDIDCADLADYEVYVERDDGARSSVRLVRTGEVPGRVINSTSRVETMTHAVFPLSSIAFVSMMSRFYACCLGVVCYFSCSLL